jgi:hypothetical protein
VGAINEQAVACGRTKSEESGKNSIEEIYCGLFQGYYNKVQKNRVSVK